MTILDIKKGLFSVCSSYLDKEDQKCIISTNDEKFKCCIKYCIPIENCYNICDKKWNTGSKSDYYKLKRCINSCENNNKQCTKICSLSREFSLSNDPFTICSSEKCFNSNKTDYKCITDNKKELINCCIENCTPSYNLDCESHCNTSYDLATIQYKPYIFPKNLKEDYVYNQNSKKILIYIIMLSFLVITFGLLLFKKIRK